MFAYRTHYEIKTEDNQYLIDVYAPGLNKKQFEVSLNGNELTVSYPEQFHKTFTLPEHKEVEARYEDGVLHIKVLRNEKSMIAVK